MTRGKNAEMLSAFEFSENRAFDWFWLGFFPNFCHFILYKKSPRHISSYPVLILASVSVNTVEKPFIL